MTGTVRFSVSSLRPPAPGLSASLIQVSDTEKYTQIETSKLLGSYPLYAYQFRWPALEDAAASLYVKYRIVDSQGPGVSMWSVPLAFNQPFFDVYRRQISTVLDLTESPKGWEKVTTIADNVTPTLTAGWQGSVQYCIALTHPENKPTPSEGLAEGDPTTATSDTVKNQYVVYVSDILPTVVV